MKYSVDRTKMVWR